MQKTKEDLCAALIEEASEAAKTVKSLQDDLKLKKKPMLQQEAKKKQAEKDLKSLEVSAERVDPDTPDI